MNLRFLRDTPFYIFLIAPLLILFLYIHNFHIASLHSTLRSYLIGVAVTFFIFTISYLLLKKNIHKAGAFTAIVLVVLFFYGSFYELIEKLFYKGLWPFSQIHRFLIIFFLLILSSFFYFLIRKKKTFQSFTYFGNLFALMLLAINIFNLLLTATKHTAAPTAQQATPTAVANDTLPDIYYIILDGYANDSILSSIYSYPSNSLTHYLQKENFITTPQSKTNYISTIPSLSSSLNLKYTDTINLSGEEQKNIIYDNEVSKHLQSKGYKIVHIRSGYSVSRENYHADTTLALNNLGEFERTLVRYSILRLDDILGYLRYNTLKEQMKVMYDALEIKGPKYVFLHIVSPHPPYVCDEEGNFKPGKNTSDMWWEPKSNYLAQLKYINKEVIKFVSKILNKSKGKAIIIVQSDHGPWIASKSFHEIHEARSKILNSYYIPYRWSTNIYPDITPVNSFRIIFNGLFNDSLKLLKDIPLDSATAKKYLPKNLLIQ